MAVTMGTPETIGRVPAWKRLGLKLKYAKDTVSDDLHKTSTSAHHSPAQPSPQNLKKRSFQEADLETPAKRAKPLPKPQTQFPPPTSNGPPGKVDSFWGSNRAAAVSTKTPKKIVFDDDE